MDRNVVIGIVVVLALLVLGWWYWAFMAPIAQAPGMPAAETVTEGESVPVIVGTWQSTEDPRFVRTFTADNTVVDTYEGMPEATATGSWTFITDLPTELPGIEPVAGTRYLKITFAEEVLYFAIVSHTDTTLAMMYLSGNGTLEFSRVQ